MTTQSLVEPSPEVELALKRYAAILSYHQYENAVYWTRSQHFLFAHAAMFAFFAARLPTGQGSTTWMSLIVLVVVAVAGFLLTRLWWRALRAGEFWHNRWLTLLQNLEPAAMGALLVMRPSESEPKRPHAKLVAKHAAILFMVLWSLVLAFVLGCLYTKYKHLTFF